MKKTVEEIRTMTTDELRNRFRELNAIIGNGKIPAELFEEYNNIDLVLYERDEEELEKDGYYDWDDNF